MKPRIVLIEDDVLLRTTTERALNEAGYQVQAHENTSEAWDALRGGPPLDLLIADLVSPAGRPHGLALAHNARRHHSGVSTIFITADLAAAAYVRGEPRSVVLMKPFKMPALLVAVAYAIGGGGPALLDRPSPI